ncbi:MAG: hypothetical protein IKP17_01085 [Oscillospiraceae bacterium]|nr:hypothetical protein [Oscillospiraceae bacterium]
MKTKNPLADMPDLLRLLPGAAALVLLLASLAFSSSPTARTVLAALSFLASLAALREDILQAIRKKDLRSGLLLLIIACLICFCIGSGPSAALAMLLRVLGSILLPLVEGSVRSLMATRRALNPLRDQLSGTGEDAGPAGRVELFLQNYFTWLMILIAALAAVLTVLLGKVGIAAALARAAVLLALGGCFPFFAAFPLNDEAAALRAGECGVLFRGGTLSELLKLKLACVETVSPVEIGSVSVYPARPEAVGADLMLRLASAATAECELPFAEQIQAVRKAKPGASVPEREVLPDLGLIARVKGVAVIIGSGELMNRSGLSVLPFPENPRILHMGVNGHYVGCIDFSEQEQGGDAPAAFEAQGFFCFSDAAEAEAKRLSGERLLFVSPASGPVPGRKEDISAVSGAEDRRKQITLERCGKSGAAALLEQLQNARLGRKGTVLVALIVKAFAFLLALFGICPLWLAVGLELAAVAFTCRYTIHLLDFGGKY